TQTTILLGDGTGNFQFNNIVGSGSPTLSADFNGDGLSDLLLFPDYFQISLSNGDGTFRNGFQFGCCAGYVLDTPDVNGDGIPDVLYLTGHDPEQLGVYFGQQDGTFIDSGTAIPIKLGVSAVADFDGNGSPDVALLEVSNGTVQILLNK